MPKIKWDDVYRVLGTMLGKVLCSNSNLIIKAVVITD